MYVCTKSTPYMEFQMELCTMLHKFMWRKHVYIHWFVVVLRNTQAWHERRTSQARAVNTHVVESVSMYRAK